jgi:hypothetical protein
MLTNISRQPLKGTGADKAPDAGPTDDAASSSIPTSDQKAGASSIQPQADQDTANSGAESVKSSAKSSVAKLDPQTDANAKSANSKVEAGKTQESAEGSDSPKAAAKKTAIPQQAASNERDQVSTLQMQFHGLIALPSEAPAVDKSDAKTATAKQTDPNQTPDQGSGLSGVTQTRSASAATSEGLELHGIQSGKGSEVPVVLAALQKEGHDSRLFASQLDPKSVNTQMPAATEDKVASATAPIDSPSTAQAALAASTPTLMANLPTNAGLSRVDQRSNHPELTSTANGSNSSTGSVTATGKAAKADGGADNGAATQGSSTSALTTQHTQAAAVQRSVVQASGAETRVMETMGGPPHTELRNFSGASNPSTVAQTGTHPANGADAEEQELTNGMASAGMSGISTARLMQTMGSSEMRMGMHSSEFGNISIHTSVSQQQIQAQISVEHNELGSALSTHINSIQSKLGSDYGLNANIQLNQSGTSFSSERDGSQQQHSRAADRPAASTEVPPTQQTDLVMPTVAVSAVSKYRLDIRA